MTELFVFLSMFFMHVLDDFTLQGIMKDLKQKAWWRKQTDHPKYSADWIPALVCHAFSWSFSIMLPIAVYERFAIDAKFLACMLFNVAVHAFVDDQKANRFTINLVQDQTCHVIQICATAAALLLPWT